MTTVNIKTKQDLVNIKKQLKNKLLSEKINEQDIQENIFKLNKPIIEPLKDLKEKVHESNLELKAIKDKPVQTIIQREIPIEREIPIQREIEAPPEPNYTHLGPLAIHYLSNVFKKDYDNAYGVKNDGQNFFIGNKMIEIDKDDIIIDGEKHEMTEEMWKLLTLSNPGKLSDYDSKDVTGYVNLMFRTKPFLKGKDGPIKANRGDKYKNIIKPIYQRYMQVKASRAVQPIEKVRSAQERRRSISEGASGSGIRAIILPSDINKLIERHRFLLAALESGNTGVFNEISAINDKLLKKGHLSKDDIRSFYTLYKPS